MTTVTLLQFPWNSDAAVYDRDDQKMHYVEVCWRCVRMHACAGTQYPRGVCGFFFVCVYFTLCAAVSVCFFAPTDGWHGTARRGFAWFGLPCSVSRRS